MHAQMMASHTFGMPAQITSRPPSGAIWTALLDLMTVEVIARDRALQLSLLPAHLGSIRMW